VIEVARRPSGRAVHDFDHRFMISTAATGPTKRM
jgi:hypothetical protein